MRVGVLAIQGDVSEHLAATTMAIERLGLDWNAVHVRKPDMLDRCDGLLIPGGESTTIIRQVDRGGLRRGIVDMWESQAPIMGTCAGCILLASRVLDHAGPEQVSPLGLVDMHVVRNAYGRQVNSFEKDLEIGGLDGNFRGVFIRAPGIVRTGEGVDVLASLEMGGEKQPVMVRQGNVLAMTFHPELTGDTRVHEMFLRMF